MKSIAYYTGVSGIIILSFLYYSSNFYPLLGSDDAVVVLMIHYFQLPHDLYFWGQDRYGSLIPLMGQLFHQGFGLSALTSESVTHYLLLVAGYFAFAGLLKSKFSKLVLAIAWFFPPMRLIDFLRLNIGQEYSLLAIGIFILYRLSINKEGNSQLKKQFLLLAITLLFIMAAWVSDLAIVSVSVILMLQVYFGLYRNAGKAFTNFRWKPAVFYVVTGVLVGAAFIYYGKFYAAKSQSYNNFNDFSTVIASFQLFWASILELLLFKAYEPFTSAYLYLLILLTLALFFLRSHIHFSENQKKWFLFFIIDFVLIFFIIMLSKWSFLNGVPRRYFTSNYITFWLAFLLAFECLADSKIKKMLRIAILFAVIIAGAGTLYNLKYIWPKTLKPRVEYVREFESLGRIGIIGNYWNSYINSVTSPDQIMATPNDRSSVRSRAMAREVMKRDTFYIIRDSWMESFPDSLNQFGTPLYKNGDEFRMGDCYVCRYRK
jgi:hypothetical protein